MPRGPGRVVAALGGRRTKSRPYRPAEAGHGRRRAKLVFRRAFPARTVGKCFAKAEAPQPGFQSPISNWRLKFSPKAKTARPCQNGRAARRLVKPGDAISPRPLQAAPNGSVNSLSRRLAAARLCNAFLPIRSPAASPPLPAVWHRMGLLSKRKHPRGLSGPAPPRAAPAAPRPRRRPPSSLPVPFRLRHRSGLKSHKRFHETRAGREPF